MALPEEPQPSTLSFSVRRKAYNEEVQRIVCEGAEHPRCELVREMPLQTLAQKVDLAKRLQGIGNALLTGERLLVIGTDQKAKAFVPVGNLPDCDPARWSNCASRPRDGIEFWA